MSGYRDRFADAIRAMLDREPEFTPTPEQLARYEGMRLPDDLMARLRERAGADACQLAELWERQGT